MGDHCQFYVVRKKRFCRMTLRPGSNYCGEHEPKIDNVADAIKDNNPNVRIACPLDSKHSCFANNLEKHLKVCNAKQRDLPSYILKNCNVSNQNDDVNSSEKRCLANVPEDLLKDVIKLVEQVYNDIIFGNIPTIPSKECHQSVIEDIDNDGRGDGTRRHLLQTSSLLYILEINNLVSENTSFVELGAGKGHFSYYLSKTVKSVPDCSVTLVDRASHRHKQDNKLRDECAVKINRIRADISDLVLAKLPHVETSSSLVAVSKHLCGVATDLALRCLTKDDVIDKTAGIVMATCCHHRCVWNTYVGQTFFQSNAITKSHFDVICGLVSWAVCGSGLSRERRNNIMSSKDPKRSKLTSESLEDKDDECDTIEKEVNTSHVVESDSHDKRYLDKKILHSPEDSNEKSKVGSSASETTGNTNYVSISKNLGLSLVQREEIGFKAKALIDWGRLIYLKSNNFDTSLCFYVDKSLSPENVCIVAKKYVRKPETYCL